MKAQCELSSSCESRLGERRHDHWNQAFGLGGIKYYTRETGKTETSDFFAFRVIGVTKESQYLRLQMCQKLCQSKYIQTRLKSTRGRPVVA